MSTASSPAAEQAAVVVARCDELATISSMPGGIRRVFLSPEHARVNEIVSVWMQQAGLRTWVDAAGNLHGRVPGDDDRPVLVLGSHLDTVVDAGRYDGIAGVLIAIAVIELLGERQAELPVAVEVVAFSDEEGTRFGKALMGSSAMAGVWDPAWWELRDADDVALREAFTAFGLDPARIADAAVDPRTLAGYLEAHIEQGPYLERADRALGVVTSIAAARRFSVDVLGEARHAGGTPYESRRDALLGAAEAALAVERICLAERHIGTVGQMHVEPGAVNVIPGHVRFSVDLRGEFDDGRDRVWDEVTAAFDEIAARRGLTITPTEVHSAPAVFCAPPLMDAIRAGIAGTGDSEPLELFSKAGHDAMSLGLVTDVAMLFLRNPGGISHHPDEFVSEADIALGIDALLGAVGAVGAVTAVTPASHADRSAMRIEDFNALADEDARGVVSTWAEVPRWVDALLAARPYGSVADIQQTAADLALTWTDDEIEGALAQHPRIGEVARGTDQAAVASRREQASSADADDVTATAIRQGNIAYEGRFGRVFLIRAAGRSAPEVLAELERRLGNDDSTERAEVAGQLREIALLRLGGSFA